ncbi:MAG: RHS domain-containing protein [Desulfuromonadales bacterium]|nr:RHS domain-containing protein [Desulfuromonadales bacterium]
MPHLLLKSIVWVAGFLSLLATQPALAETVYYYHTDPAGTPLAITNQYGVKTWEADYLPFGEVYTETGVANDRKFVGKERDEESQLDYFGARYHYAKIGRFLAVDPVRAVAPRTGQFNAQLLQNPQRHNLYSYSLNNNYRNVDADGRFPMDTIWDIGNIVYDIVTGDKVGLAADTAALAIPYVPAGLSKIGKAAKGADNLITVRTYTNATGREGITNSGTLRADTWVTLPGEMPAKAGHVQIEKILEIQPGRGEHFLEFQVPASNLRVPANGSRTSGGAMQFQLNKPVQIDPSKFSRPLGRPRGEK